MNKELIKESIIDLFNKSQLWDLPKIIKFLGINNDEDIIMLKDVLKELEDDYEIMHNHQNQYGLLSAFKYAKGPIEIKDGGFGFVICELGDIHVYSSKTGTALNKDIVLVSYYETLQNRREGIVEKIITRNTIEVIGKVEKKRQAFIVRSNDKKINLVVYLINDKKASSGVGYIVKAHIDKYYPNNTADGHIEEIIGLYGDKGVDIDSIIAGTTIQVNFSEDALKEAKKIPQIVDVNKYNKRVDLLKYHIITIDGDDARDFDDAVRIEKLDNGNYLLGVYIADVSEYVKEGSFLDIDAFNRGTSIYLPDRVIPMLPIELSNGICSLNEGVNRLVMACDMEINSEGKVVNHHIYEGMIASFHRMTYNKVNAILEDNNHDLINQYLDIYQDLKDMAELSSILQNMRVNRGSFEFETSEPHLILDENGKVIKVENRQQRMAEQLIEEFMLIANETVAEAMTWLDVPFLYRVHDEPSEERINDFLLLINSLGIMKKANNKKSLPKILQSILMDKQVNSDPELKAIVNKSLLRSMAKAKYQENNIGHYGLASECYTHFTSPIRRYPDLLVHRLIKQFMLNDNQVNVDNPYKFYQTKVNQAGITSSAREREAENLERDCIKYKLVEYMEQFVGKMFEATISSITNWGMYVTMENSIEGLLAYENMPDLEYRIETVYGYVQGYPSQTIYRLGSKIRVKVLSVNKEKREIDLKLFKGGAEHVKKPRR